MRRVTSGSNCFTYVCVRNSCVGSSIGAIALIAKVTQAHFTAGNRNCSGVSIYVMFFGYRWPMFPESRLTIPEI